MQSSSSAFERNETSSLALGFRLRDVLSSRTVCPLIKLALLSSLTTGRMPLVEVVLPTVRLSRLSMLSLPHRFKLSRVLSVDVPRLFSQLDPLTTLLPPPSRDGCCFVVLPRYISSARRDLLVPALFFAEAASERPAASDTALGLPSAVEYVSDVAAVPAVSAVFNVLTLPMLSARGLVGLDISTWARRRRAANICFMSLLLPDAAPAIVLDVELI